MAELVRYTSECCGECGRGLTWIEIAFGKVGAPICGTCINLDLEAHELHQGHPFRFAWAKLERKGQVDYYGSPDCQRCLSEWLGAGKPKDVELWISENANGFTEEEDDE